jgi:hypothetical protein
MYILTIVYCHSTTQPLSPFFWHNFLLLSLLVCLGSVHCINHVVCSELIKLSNNALFREYFYGIANGLAPHSNIVNFSNVSVYRIGGGHQAPCSALPTGAEPVADPTRLVVVNISTDMVHTVLAVSYAKEPDEIISR